MFSKRSNDWLSKSEPARDCDVLAGILLLAVAWSLGFSEALAAEVMEGDTQKFDEHGFCWPFAVRAIRRPADRTGRGHCKWRVTSRRFGGAAGLEYRDRQWSRVTCGCNGGLGCLTFVLLSVLSGTGLALILKEIFQRPRPQIVPHLTDISTASFPSGHSMLSSVVYLTLAALLARVVPDRRTKVYFLAVAPFLVLLIGSSRVYLGVHYPTDVLAGWCLGSVWALLCCLVAHFVASRRLVTGSEQLSEDKSSRTNGPTGT